ncbi:Fcf2 pre-rRNA processing-domain-containing protein [Collybia nuda]|uniref:Fcf2 pre-rRNA processing-domain-containing protein n=1 Tax=Collybia nuda TaxID=64659 RepID=A0A9P5YH51_9AGAR|nr:Fcf2 pre-rRNA processing-domain-containing protein [Collybia nuda]
MRPTNVSNDKGRGETIDLTIMENNPASSSDSTSSASGSDSDSEVSDLDSDITPEFLTSLLEKARKNAITTTLKVQDHEKEDEVDMIKLGDESNEAPLPSLNPGKLPPPYFTLFESPLEGPSSMRDPGAELAEKASSSRDFPAPPIPPPELLTNGKPLTKKQKKALKHVTAGPDWFDLPAPAEADLPRLFREVEALRLRNQLDPKRFYRKDEGEGKGIKGLPKYFAVGTIVPSSTPFGTASGDNLARVHRKRTLVDELVDDAEAKRYAKKKFEQLQGVRGERGRNTMHAKRTIRREKW